MKNIIPIRLWFALMAAILWTGIYLTGFSLTSWVLYVPAIGLTASAIIGNCPLQLLAASLLVHKKKQNP